MIIGDQMLPGWWWGIMSHNGNLYQPTRSKRHYGSLRWVCSLGTTFFWHLWEVEQPSHCWLSAGNMWMNTCFLESLLWGLYCQLLETAKTLARAGMHVLGGLRQRWAHRCDQVPDRFPTDATQPVGTRWKCVHKGDLGGLINWVSCLDDVGVGGHDDNQVVGMGCPM